MYIYNDKIKTIVCIVYIIIVYIVYCINLKYNFIYMKEWKVSVSCSVVSASLQHHGL